MHHCCANSLSMRTLLLDTSGAYSSVVVAENQVVLGASAVRGRPAARVHEQIRTLLLRLDLPLRSIDRIGVVIGPGSWTGLNIGVTAAKTLAQVLETPVAPISTLDALVLTHRWTTGRIGAFMSAARRQVYCCWYAMGEDGVARTQKVLPEVMAFDTWRDLVAGEEGTPLLLEYGRVFSGTLKESLPHILVESRDRLHAEALVAAAHESAPRAGSELLALAPAYLQASLAEWDARP